MGRKEGILHFKRIVIYSVSVTYDYPILSIQYTDTAEIKRQTKRNQFYLSDKALLQAKVKEWIDEFNKQNIEEKRMKQRGTDVLTIKRNLYVLHDMKHIRYVIINKTRQCEKIN